MGSLPAPATRAMLTTAASENEGATVTTNGSQPAPELYSGLRFLLDDRGLTVADLARHVMELGATVDVRTLQRLSDPDRPIKQVDARVVALICEALGVDLGGLLAVMPPHSARLDRLSDEAQDRLDDLLDRQREEQLRDGEFSELRSLVEHVGQQSVRNAQRLVEHRQRLRDAILSHQQSAAD